MLILGLLILACTAAFTGLVLADNLSGGPDYRVTVLGEHIATMNSLAIFCAGLALALIFAFGCLMMLAGGAMRRRKMRQLVEVRREAAATARERDALAARLEERDPASARPEADHWTGSAPEGGFADSGTSRDRSWGPDERVERDTAGATRADVPAPRHRRNGLHLFGH